MEALQLQGGDHGGEGEDEQQQRVQHQIVQLGIEQLCGHSVGEVSPLGSGGRTWCRGRGQRKGERKVLSLPRPHCHSCRTLAQLHPTAHPSVRAALQLSKHLKQDESLGLQEVEVVMVDGKMGETGRPSGSTETLLHGWGWRDHCLAV